MEANIILAAAFSGLAAIACWRGVDFSGAVPAIAVALPGILLMGKQETSVESIHWAAYVLPACAPLVLVITLPFARWPKLHLHLLRLALVLALLTVSIVLAQQGGALDFGTSDW
jgi:hypothetical protein